MKLPTLIVLLGACGLLAGCGGLAGEPRIVSTLPPSTPAPTDVGHPLSQPDIAAGAALFAQNCVPCHGADGKGKGALVQSGQVPPPLDFTDPATSNSDTPVTWYNTITNGNIEHFMPPWHDALSDDQRWDAAMYVYTLADPPDLIAHGHDLFNADCPACDVSSLTGLAAVASISQNDLTSRIAAMPQFASLSEADRRAVAAYVRTLALANPDAIGATPEATVEPPAATPELTSEVTPTAVTVNGKISNGSAGGSVPSDLKLTLFTFDANLNQKQLDANANADGSYSFANVSLDLNSTYVITTAYRDRVFTSALLSGDALKTDAADGTLDLPVTIYELTEDPDVIQIVGLVTQVTVVGDSLQVAQVFNVTNTSDRAFTSSNNASNGNAISLVITLPPGAVVAGFPDNQNRYVVDQNNFTVFDTIPVLPKEQHVVQVVYLIQYSQDAIIEQPMNYALVGPVRLLVSPTNVNVVSEQLPALGLQTVGNTQYQSFGANLTLSASQVVRYEVSGAGLSDTQNADRNAPVVSSNNLIVIVVGVLIVAGLIGGGLFLIASRNRSGDQQIINILVRQVAELDADHDAGKIDDEAYTQQRSALKARLAALMERKK